ncbi:MULTISPECIES: zinc ribbon domain-containing protein [unclassified Pseudoclavibacter]|uniref:zinc ribbon domain-containing protein n=1 Tax=unclassified Pseudoclavibacter TaxID=2615177 RepID=UPI0012F1EDEA|nr:MULTISPECIES: hypothetical protein [unclassified Pseudoclavibacter]MBF4458159.1 hypothetical protein [Pseudoclavibacter sp. VKM Ac-2867]VXB30400.1 conserved hypothetical protein [Pseudoclavibacter sp. 8L]
MKASEADQRRLLDLAEVDTKRRRVQHVAKNLPEQHHLNALDEERTKHRAEVVQLLGQLEDSRSELKKIESDVETVEARLKRDNDRLQGASSRKDIEALQREIEVLQRRRTILEDGELVVMQRVEEQTAAHEGALESQRSVEDRARELTVLRDAARDNLKGEYRVLSEQRASVLASLPAELVALYEKQRERYGVGAAELIGNITTGTNVALDRPELEKIRRAAPDDVVICPDSGAVLVRTEKSAL